MWGMDSDEEDPSSSRSNIYRPVDYEYPKQFAKCKKVLDRDMDPSKALQWLRDFETVIKEKVDLYYYHKCKTKTPTLLQSEWIQHKFGLNYSLLTGKGDPTLADLVASRTARITRSVSGASSSASSSAEALVDSSSLTTKKKQDEHRQLLEHWALWCLCSEEGLVESGLRRDVTRHLNVMAKGKFGDDGAPSVREAVKYILGNLKPQKLAVKHVIKLISTPRGQLPLAEWIAKMRTMQKDSKAVGIAFSKPSQSEGDDLEQLQVANSNHEELTHQFFAMMLSTKEKQFLADKNLSDASLEDLHKALGLGGEHHHTLEQQRLLFQQGHGNRVWQERKNFLAKNFGLQQKKQQLKKKQQEERKQQQQPTQPMGPPLGKPLCKECGNNHRGRCNPEIVARNAAAAAKRAAAKAGGGPNNGNVHQDRAVRFQANGGAQSRSRSSSRSRKANRFNAELPRLPAAGPTPDTILQVLPQGSQSEVTGGATMYDTLLQANPVFEVLKKKLVVTAKGNGQVFTILVGADTDSNICVLSKSALGKAKLVPKEAAMQRMDSNFVDYVKQAPTTVSTLAGSEKIGALKFVEVMSSSGHKAGKKAIVIPVFACDRTCLLDGTEGLLSYHVCRKVFGDAFSVPEGINHPESPAEGEEGC